MKENSKKFPSKYLSRKPTQVYSSMVPLFSDKFKIYNTHQRELKNLLLKTNNKLNRATGNSVKNPDIPIRSWIATILSFLSHAGLGSLTKNILRRPTNRLLHTMMFNNKLGLFKLFVDSLNNIRMVF